MQPTRSLRTAALSAVLAAFIPAAPHAEAKSSIAYYPVKGRTAPEIYASIKTSAPRIAANTTMAFTAIATKTNKTEREQGGQCSYISFNTRAAYSFYIPKHQNAQSLPKQLRSRWLQFAEYLLRHEEGHRTIWQLCLADYDARALELRAPSCATLDAARERLFTAIKSACLAKDEAYDAVFRKEVQTVPFMKEALKKAEK
jgi:predicted secreted Zn-dependent protease